MNRKYLVNLYDWENPRLCFGKESDFNSGDFVVVAADFGNDVGVIEKKDVETGENPVFEIIRAATERDLDVFHRNAKKKPEILNVCKSEIRRLDLEMKLVDARVSLDGSGMTVIFTSDGRVDFRDLVKNLSRIFHRSVKMHQIGSRDEARKFGDCGVCGRELCCVKFAGNLPSISTEMARAQRVSHRGAERISGACGRLMCCLSYEFDQYRELLKGMPEMHSFVKIKEGKGEVLEINAITGDIRLKLEDGSIVNIKKENLV